MFDWLTPRRRRGVEYLDDPAIDPAVRARAMADLARSNRYFGGTRAVIRAIARLPMPPRGARVLDVGTGSGDIAEALQRSAHRAGQPITVIGLDMSPSLLLAARQSVGAVVGGDALRLPIRDASVDMVVCSQLLHHFEAADAERLVAELHRVSRGWIIVADLRRSVLAVAGFWIAATALRFHRITRADGVTSVLRGFTSAELSWIVRRGAGTAATVRRAAFWRLVATWPHEHRSGSNL